MASQPNRAGSYITHNGYKAFMPKPLPPEPPLALDNQMLALLSEADQAVGRLDAATELVPNPDLFVAMYVYREAVLSS
jgi:Fic family protein